MLELSETYNDEIGDPEIKARDAKSSRNAFTRHYLATERGSEVGFLSIELNPDDEHFYIDEIFVPSVLRRHGIGTKLLEAAENIASGFGYQSILLVPTTLDQAFDQQTLEDWYTRNGYMLDENSGPGAFIKRLQWRR
jgi:GNAT superfamily N-acetyltransferase